MTNKGDGRKAYTSPGPPPTQTPPHPSSILLTTDPGSTTASNPSSRGSVSPTSSKPKPVVHYHDGKPNEPSRREAKKHPKHWS